MEAYYKRLNVCRLDCSTVTGTVRPVNRVNQPSKLAVSTCVFSLLVFNVFPIGKMYRGHRSGMVPSLSSSSSCICSRNECFVTVTRYVYSWSRDLLITKTLQKSVNTQFVYLSDCILLVNTKSRQIMNACFILPLLIRLVLRTYLVDTASAHKRKVSKNHVCICQ